MTQLTLDMTDADSPERIREALDGKPADVVLSDMHAPAMGHKSTDHLRIMSLVEAALDLAEEILAPGGAFLCKVLQGGADKELVARLNRSFAKVRHVKPKASPRQLRRDVCARHGLPRRGRDMRCSRNCAACLCCIGQSPLLSFAEIPS